MIEVVKKAKPAAIAILRQATALFPNRKKASDGLLPSAAHQLQNPTSDHNLGEATDLTHDPAHGVDCHELFEKFKEDSRVKYLIFDGQIWSDERHKEGNRKYTGPNKHPHHLHVSIYPEAAEDTSNWFPWLPKPKTIGKIIAKIQPLPKKKVNK